MLFVISYHVNVCQTETMHSHPILKMLLIVCFKMPQGYSRCYTNAHFLLINTGGGNDEDDTESVPTYYLITFC